jgi:hypothetical protein
MWMKKVNEVLNMRHHLMRWMKKVDAKIIMGGDGRYLRFMVKIDWAIHKFIERSYHMFNIYI